jgi:hypothetical protein
MVDAHVGVWREKEGGALNVRVRKTNGSSNQPAQDEAMSRDMYATLRTNDTGASCSHHRLRLGMVFITEKGSFNVRVRKPTGQEVKLHRTTRP